MSLTDILSTGNKLKQAAVGAYVSLPAIAQAKQIDYEGGYNPKQTLMIAAATVVGGTLGMVMVDKFIDGKDIPRNSLKAKAIYTAMIVPAAVAMYLVATAP